MKNILTFFYLFITVAIFAQAPQKFNYQAVARNAQGAVLANQSIKIRASILDGSANGSSQYSETHSITSNSLGLFTLAIGGGNAVSGKFTDITWSSGDKYLKIEMDATGGNNYALMGTSQLLSVPYALNAGNGSQWSKNGNDIYYNRGSIGLNCKPEEQLFAFDRFKPQNQICGSTYFGLQHGIGGAPNGLPFELGDSSHVIWIGDFKNPTPRRLDGTWNSDYAVIYGNYDTSYNKVTKRFGDKFSLNFIVGDNGDGSDSPEVEVEDFIFLGLSDHRIQKVDGVTIKKYNMGISNPDPKSKLHVSQGDVYIDQIDSGVIMKSPNGQCWRMTVSNAGQPVFSSITCP